jgi:hypothetical protein
MRMRRRVAIGLFLLLTVPATTPVRVEGQQPAAPGAPAWGQSATTLPDGTVLLVGGEGRAASAAVYDPRTGALRPVGTLAAPRAWHTATLLPDGTVVVAGGTGADGQLADRVERFDPAALTITMVEGLALTPRAHHTATVLTDGRVLFAGGDTAGGGGVAAEV